MNKKKQISILAIILLGFISTNHLHAQRYLPGQKGIQFTGGLAGMADGAINKEKEPSYYFGIAVSTYTQNRNRWVIGGEFLNKEFRYKETVILVSRFLGDGGYYFKILSDYKKIFSLSFGLTACAGYETSNRGEKLLYDGATLNNKDTFIYGGSGIVELEIFLSNKMVFLINSRERLLLGSSVDKFQTHYGAGIKFIIY